MAINVSELKQKESFSLSEAKKLIAEIVPYWEAEGQKGKIQSLANWIVKWLKEDAEKDNMKIYYSEIVAIKRRMGNATKLGKSVDALQEELNENQVELGKLEAIYGKYVPPKSNPKKKE
jgi:hypothetical protein